MYDLSLNYYLAGLASAHASYNQCKSTETEYYNSDDEGEPLCSAVPTAPKIPLGNYATPSYIDCSSSLYLQTPYNPTPYNPSYQLGYQQPNYAPKNDGGVHYHYHIHNNKEYKKPQCYPPKDNINMVYHSGHQKTRFGYIPYPQKCVKTSYYIKPTKKLRFSLGYKKPCSKTIVYNNYYTESKNQCVKSYKKPEECKNPKYDQKFTTCDYLDYKPKQCYKKNTYPSFPTPPPPPKQYNNYCAPKNDYCAPKNDYCAPKNDYCAPKNDYCTPYVNHDTTCYTTPSYATPSYAPPSYAPPSYTPPSYHPPSYAPPSYAPPYYTDPIKSQYDASYCEYINELSTNGCPITYDCSYNACQTNIQYPSHYYNTGYLRYNSQVSGYPKHNYY